MTPSEDWEDFLEEQHKIKPEVWQRRGLRFNVENLYIPYFSDVGKLLFEKIRREPTYIGEGKYLYPSGAHIALYPSNNLSKSSEWFLTEGELDCLTLESFDFPAVTTGGVTSFKHEFASYFKDKKVFICFDNDQAGKDGSAKVAQILATAGANVFILNLPVEENSKDIGDYFRLGHSREDFARLADQAIRFHLEKRNQYSETETPDAIQKEPLLKISLTYSQIEEKVEKFVPSSKTALKLILSVAVSSQYPNSHMSWLLLVGVPSSGKTDLVRLIKDSEITYSLDNLTQNSFISGERATRSNKVYDLLPLLDKKCLVIKDWTAILSQDEKMTRKLLGDFVGIYDKEFTKFSSRRGNISYFSTFSQIGCITPATLNRHTQYMNMVGPRFLCYTMPKITPDEEDTSYELIFSNKDRSLIEKETRLYVSSYLSQLVKQDLDIKPISRPVQTYLRLAAKLMANCRGIAILQSATFKNEEGEDVKYYEPLDVQIEEPWRAVQQLISLSTYLAFVVGNGQIGIDEISIIKEVVISSMPADRSQALRIIKDNHGMVTAKELSDLSEKSTKTSRRLLDELVALKALDKIRGSGTIATGYKIVDTFKDFLLLDPAEFLSRNQASGTETRDAIASVDQFMQ
jgi:hypothetical protein